MKEKKQTKNDYSLHKVEEEMYLLSDRGYIKAKDVLVGDLLFNGSGFVPLKKTKKKSDEKKLEIRTQNNPKISTNKDVCFYTRERIKEWNKKSNKMEDYYSPPKWKRAEDLTENDYLYQGTISYEANIMNLDFQQCWLLGRYVADGYIKNKTRPSKPNSKENIVVFCVGKDKISDFNFIDRYHLCKYEEKLMYRVLVSNKELMDLCIACGRGAGNKKIPNFILNLPKDLLRAFIEGYLSGDGYTKDNKEYVANSVSEDLIKQLSVAITKAYDKPCSVYFLKTPDTINIKGLEYNQKDKWIVRFSKGERNRPYAALIDGEYWQKIKDLKEVDKTYTFYEMQLSEKSPLMINTALIKE